MPSPSHPIIQAGEPVLRVQARLGEGPVWDTRENVLYFVDIPNGEIHRFDPASQAHTHQSYGKPIGNVQLRRNKPGLLVAAARELYRTDPTKPGELFLVAEPVPASSKALQFNDGYCDKAGRWLTGTKAHENPESVGTADLFQLAPDGATKTLISNITCSNGTAFSPADDVIYFIDSPSGTIDAYDYSVADGSFSNKRTVVSLPPQSEEDKGVRGEGGFDGMCADEDGNLYVALWQRSVLYRFTPQGELTLEIQFPKASNITAPVFGGPDMDTLYITTASCTESGEAHLVSRWPEGGDLYAVKLEGVRGREKYRCAWEGDA